tara:strand:- start:17156 stop:18121 length:966 start_codon:yes stop_codon:yes gene_type:complete
MTTTTGKTQDQLDKRKGFLFASGAFGWWAVMVPLFFRTLSKNGAVPLEVLAQRVVFGLPILILILAFAKRLPELYKAFTTWSSLKVLIPTTGLISINWFFFIYAVSTDRLNHASLGYYINPLFSIMLGFLFLGEKLSRLQKIAIGIAVAAVGMMTVAELQAGGGWPWISLLLPTSFGIYGLLRKQVNVTGTIGLTFEMAMLFPICIGLMIYLAQSNTGIFMAESTPLPITLLMLLGGVFTIIPLVCFTNAVRLLPLSTIGLLQFTAPTGQLLLSVVFFGEKFTPLKFAAFVLIWVAIAVFLRDLVVTHRERQACLDLEIIE